MQAAQDPKWFQHTNISTAVAEFLVSNLTEDNLSNVSFRTLKKGYHLAEMHPDEWKELFSDVVPKKIEKQKVEPMKLIESLIKDNLKVKDQAQIFQEKTGLSLRTFYSYRKLIETLS